MEFQDLGGFLPRLKGLGWSWQAPRHVIVEPHAGFTTFLDYPAPGTVGVYGHGGVRLQRGSEALLDSPGHRARMPRLPWTPADALYFFGYALLDYLSLPFLLETCRFVRSDLSSVTVEMPTGRDSHCARQRFWFDDEGLLRRQDYRADVIGRTATGAHTTSDYVEVDGIPFATRRRVTVRFGSLATPLPVLEARMGSFRVTHGSPAAS